MGQFYKGKNQRIWQKEGGKPGGLLGIMTERWTTLDQFAKWYYTKDPTHTSFYHESTFSFLCRQFGLKVLWNDENRVVILRDCSTP